MGPACSDFRSDGRNPIPHDPRISMAILNRARSRWFSANSSRTRIAQTCLGFSGSFGQQCDLCSKQAEAREWQISSVYASLILRSAIPSHSDNQTLTALYITRCANAAKVRKRHHTLRVVSRLSLHLRAKNASSVRTDIRTDAVPSLCQKDGRPRRAQADRIFERNK
jgi:hypothetical protein